MEHEQAPVRLPLPDPPSYDFMSEAQWQVLFALLDGVLPSYVPASAAGKANHDQIAIPDKEFNETLALASRPELDLHKPQDIAALLASRPTQDPAFREDVQTTLANSPQREKLAKVLGLLATRAGALSMTRYWTPVHQQPADVREAIVKSWINSSFLQMRSLGKSLTAMAQKAHLATSPHLQPLLGYTDTPKDWKVGTGYDYTFLQVPQHEGQDKPHIIETDVVIVGSGCGGAVAAKNLAEAGHRVLVADKGYYFAPEFLPMTQSAATRYLYDHGGAHMSEDNAGTSLVNGSTWGGGGTVNWSVSLKLQDFVRSEWASAGLPLFTSPQFDECNDRVCDFMQVSSTGIRHNHTNRVIIDGCEKLGWKQTVAPQNTGGKEHYCGQCSLGCGSSEKRGPTVSWLPAAAEAGAQFIEGFQVDRVIFDDKDKTVAVGVEGTWTSRSPDGGVHESASKRRQEKVIVKAKKVVVSAGALWSPLVLMRSGVENASLGQNLHIHPCNMVSGTYEEDIRPWEGGIITSYCGEFENLDGEGHGVKLEATNMVPYNNLSLRPWTSGLDSKLAMMKHRHTSGFISLTRDRDTGHVFPDPITGGPRIDYTASDFDRAHTLEGVEALAKLCYVTGAVQIQAALPGLQPFVPKRDGRTEASGSKDPEFTDPAFAEWLQQVRKVGNKAPTAVWVSAHQMGSCRMSATEEKGVVDSKGRVWGKKNLLVADSSIFPSASGVNPMVTVMALADWVSRCLDEELKSETA